MAFNTHLIDILINWYHRVSDAVDEVGHKLMSFITGFDCIYNHWTSLPLPHPKKSASVRRM